MKWKATFIVFLALLFVSPTMALAEKVFKVGVVGPFTGPSAKNGTEIKNSASMAMERVGNKIGDYRIELVWIDSQSDPAKAASAYEEAIQSKGIDAALQDYHSSTSVALMDLAAKYKIPHMFTGGGTGIINDKYASDPEKYSYWVGKLFPRPENLMKMYAGCVAEAIEKGLYKPKNKLFAIVAEETDWGRSGANGIKAAFGAQGWKMLSEDYIPATQTDFYPLLSKYKKNGVDFIWTTLTTPASMVNLAKQIRELKVKSLFIADAMSFLGDVKGVVGKNADYAIDVSPQFITEEGVTWRGEFLEKYGYNPSAIVGGHTFDASNFFIKIAKRTIEVHGELTTETLYKVLMAEVATGKLTYGKADGALVQNEYKYTPETMPDPVVSPDAFFFPVVQFFDGEPHLIYPESVKTQDFKMKP